MKTLMQCAIKQMADQGPSVHTLESIVERTLENCAIPHKSSAHSFIIGAVIEAFKIGMEQPK